MLDQHNASRARSLSLSLTVPYSLPCSLEKKTLMPVTLVHSTPHNANTYHMRSIALSLAVPYSLPCSLERKTLILTLEFKTGSAGYLKISKIKKSPQVGWVGKLQRTSGYHAKSDGSDRRTPGPP